MKQIIVNVCGLSEEEKENVNEALAKITGCIKMTSDFATANWMYAPGTCTLNQITWSEGDIPNAGKEITHTAHEVLEMAGMATNRKVRSDFDPKRTYSVDVSNCNENEKKKVQQAFFDAGFLWRLGGKEYQHLGAEQYSNEYNDGTAAEYCLFGEIKEGSMTPKEFFELVYEPEYQGHPHARLMAQYAEDAKTTDKPWKLWEYKGISTDWLSCGNHPSWVPSFEYRRKPKTKLIHGVEIPDISFIPEPGENYYYPDIDLLKLYHDDYCDHSFSRNEMRIKGDRCYPYTDEGKQAAIKHSRALLGLAD